MLAGAGIIGGAPSFFSLAFFTLSLMASMSSFPSVGAVMQQSEWEDVNCAVKVNRFRDAYFAQC